MQERKMNEVFEEDGQNYKVLASGNMGCSRCAFEDANGKVICQKGNEKVKSAKPYHLVCFAKYRSDNTSVYFVKTK